MKKPNKEPNETSSYEPDYSEECDNCGQSPIVTIVNKKGKVLQNFHMCGPCTFGSAECIDPCKW